MVGMRRLALVALVALSCGALPAHAQTLSLAYKSGDTFKYAIHSVLEESLGSAGVSIPIDIDMTANETVKVTSVDSSGTSDLTITVSNISVKTTSNGVTNTTTGTAATSIEMKVASDGRVQSVNGISAGGNPFTMVSNIGGGFITAVLPDTAVKPGDTWSKSYDRVAPDGSASAHITATSRYLRDESVSGTGTAVVETNSTTAIELKLGMGTMKPVIGPNGSPEPAFPIGDIESIGMKGTIHSDVTSWIDPAAHHTVKTHEGSKTDLTMTTTMASGSPTMPGMDGPFSVKGTETTDLTPV
jgi:hypothetical protein